MSVRTSRTLEEIRKAIASGFREVWGQWSGRIGFIILIGVIAVSIYAVLVVPPEIIELWKTPWEDTPALAPPEWISLFGYPVAKHRIYSELSPQETYKGIPRLPELQQAIGGGQLALVGYVEVYRVEYILDSDAFPKGVTVFFEPINNSVIYDPARKINRTITAAALLILSRPDGISIVIGTAGPQTIESIRALRIEPKLFSAELAKVFRDRYGVVVPVEKLEKLATEYLFGTPGPEAAAPLKGTYRLTLMVLYSGARPDHIERAIAEGEIGFKNIKIIVKGNAYGWLGTDVKGRDLALGVLYGFPVALLVGIFAAVSVVIIGLLLGVVSGYYGGFVDEFIQRLVDVIGNIPLLPILVLIGAIVQGMPELSPWHKLFVIIGFLVIFSWGGLTIVVRAMTLSIKAEPYIEAARAVGASNARIILRHILPQILPYAMASLVFTVPSAILTEAGLSVLGIEHGLPTWGKILSDALAERGVSYKAWWWIFPPGAFMAITALAFVLIGLAIETIVEPRLRR